MSQEDLNERIRDLEEELQLALGAAEDIRALKLKCLQLMERQRTEKETRIACEKKLRTSEKKVEMLSDHVEKLMLHLKHESAGKTKAQELHRRAEKEAGLLREHISALNRKVAIKERAIAELREGSRVLEDQLRLMDEKFLELRTKLDYTRTASTRKVKAAQQEAQVLRMKYTMAMGANRSLDSIAIPRGSVEDAMNEMDGGSPLDFPTDMYGSQPEFGTSPQFGSRRLPGTGQSGRSRTGGSSRASRKLPQATFEQVQTKIKIANGEPPEWTEERARALANSRR